MYLINKLKFCKLLVLNELAQGQYVWQMCQLPNVSHKRFPATISSNISCKIFLQQFPATFPSPFPARFSCKNFLQDFPELDPDWLAPHHPILNAKFPPITALLNRRTYHKSAKVSPPPFPKILWEPQINE